jgi:hypothetical protein
MNAMDLVRLLRMGLRGIAAFLGSIGIFCLYWSCLGVPVAAYALVFLGTATAIALAADTESRFRR